MENPFIQKRRGLDLPLTEGATPYYGGGIRAYHGTPYDFDRFSLDYASHQAEPAIFFSTNPAQASAFANEPGGRVIPVEIAPKNPKVVDFSQEGKSIPYSGKAMQQALQDARAVGHDALIVKGMREVPSRGATEGDQIAVFLQNRVKNAITGETMFSLAPYGLLATDALDRAKSILRDALMGKSEARD